MYIPRPPTSSTEVIANLQPLQTKVIAVVTVTPGIQRKRKRFVASENKARFAHLLVPLRYSLYALTDAIKVEPFGNLAVAYTTQTHLFDLLFFGLGHEFTEPLSRLYL